MDGPTFRDAVESAKATQLDRLGSSKLLVALTGAELDANHVLEVAAHSEHAAVETFEAWADSESDDEVRAAFEAVAAQETDHRRRVLDAIDDGSFEPEGGGPMHSYLQGRTDTVERVAGGMVGRPLVSLRTHTQLISFFVNAAEESRADLFRDLKTETAGVIDDGLALLEDRCEPGEDWERAQMVAEYVIQVAYDDYADALESMGVNPKSVC
ncbi:MAG: rubrerythrin family protein [Halobacteriota archaeon]